MTTAKMNIPALRFSEYYSDYEKHSFKDIFLFATGKNIKQSEASPEFQTPCVRYGELYHMYNEVIYEIVNKTNLDKSELLFSKGDEILLPSAGEDPLDIGSASALTIENIAIGRTINILRPLKDNIYFPIYVSYYINQKLRKKISTLAKGSSISNVYNSDLKKLEIILPKFPEQKKTASFLTAVDKKTAQLQQKKTLLQDYKKGVMQQLFSQQLRFKDDAGNDFPDWEEKKLENFIEIKSGKSPSKFELKENGKTPFIKVEELNNCNKYQITSRFYSEELKGGIKSNSIIFPKRGAAIWNNKVRLNALPIYMDSNMMAIIPNEKYLKPEYLYYLITHMKLFKIADTSTIPQINNKHIVQIKFSKLHLEEQTKIANFLSDIDKKIELVNTQIENTQQFKKGLLQQMFV